MLAAAAAGPARHCGQSSHRKPLKCGKKTPRESITNPDRMAPRRHRRDSRAPGRTAADL